MMKSWENTGTVDQPSRTQENDRRARILDGALKVFLAYGFTRATMDDIARASDISRPALYLLFRNKTDIYRAIGEALLEESIEKARDALSRKGSLADRFQMAVETALIALMDTFHNSPHGAEMLDMKNSLAGDIVGGWRERLVELFARAIDGEAVRTGTELSARGLSAPVLANLLLDGLEGMKTRANDPDAQRKGASELIRVIELALKP
jgi:AcrR family transcriptional regulator